MYKPKSCIERKPFVDIPLLKEKKYAHLEAALDSHNGKRTAYIRDGCSLLRCGVGHKVLKTMEVRLLTGF